MGWSRLHKEHFEATVDEKREAPRWECGVGKEESLFHAAGRDLREEVDHDGDDGGLERDHEVSLFVCCECVM